MDPEPLIYDRNTLRIKMQEQDQLMLQNSIFADLGIYHFESFRTFVYQHF